MLQEIARNCESLQEVARNCKGRKKLQGATRNCEKCRKLPELAIPCQKLQEIIRISVPDTPHRTSSYSLHTADKDPCDFLNVFVGCMWPHALHCCMLQSCDRCFAVQVVMPSALHVEHTTSQHCNDISKISKWKRAEAKCVKS